MIPTLSRRLHVTVALASAAAGLSISAAHPLGQGLMPLVFAAAVLLLYFRPAVWPLMLLGALPLAGLAPWTGWLLLDEVDLLVLACAAGGHAALARTPAAGAPIAKASPSALERVFILGWCLLLGAQLLSLLQVPGLLAQGVSLSPTGTYHEAQMGLRLIKPLVAVALLWPLWPLTPSSQLHRGLWLMAATCGAWVVWERATYAGVFDFSIRYRVTGPFWETHVGGASLDAFLAVAWPITLAALAGAVRAHRHPLRVGAAALVALMCLYAMVVTYSRITYGALVVVTLAWLVLDGVVRREAQRQTPPGSAGPMRESIPMPRENRSGGLQAGTRHLLTALTAAAVLWLAQATLRDSGVIMTRFETVTKDWTVRSDHWRSALELLRSPQQWAIGLGPGQFARAWRERLLEAEAGAEVAHKPGEPGAQAGSVRASDERAFKPGTHRVVQHEGLSALRIEASAGARYWAQQHRVFQRLSADAPAQAVMQFRAKVAAPTGPGTLVVELCEKQLLYARRCAPRYVPVLQTAQGQWLDLKLALAVRPRNLADISSPDPDTLRPLTLSLLSRDSRHPIIVTDVSIRTPAGQELVNNRDFSKGLERWFFSSDMGHLPWSAHNAAVHVLVEGGWVAAAGWVLMLAAAWGACAQVLLRLRCAPRQPRLPLERAQARGQEQVNANALAPSPPQAGGFEMGSAATACALAAAILGWMLVGVVDSLLNQVRAATLLLLLLSAAIALRRGSPPRASHRA